MRFHKHYLLISVTKRNKLDISVWQRQSDNHYYAFGQLQNVNHDYKTELVKGSEKRAEDSTKRAGTELEQEVAKKQKINYAKLDDDQEEARMKELMNIVPDDEEVAIDDIPLATKPPCIVDWKIIKEGKLGYYQIIRADRSLRRYPSMIQMLQNFDRDNLETLWKLVKAKHGSTRPYEGYERVLWGDLMTMFEPDVESPVWRTLFLSSSQNSSRILEVFESILLLMLLVYKLPLLVFRVNAADRVTTANG
ncbi:hypothetical protein Tco_0956888 [Tanacetum coccineum]